MLCNNRLIILPPSDARITAKNKCYLCMYSLLIQEDYSLLQIIKHEVFTFVCMFDFWRIKNSTEQAFPQLFFFFYKHSKYLICGVQFGWIFTELGSSGCFPHIYLQHQSTQHYTVINISFVTFILCNFNLTAIQTLLIKEMYIFYICNFKCVDESALTIS